MVGSIRVVIVAVVLLAGAVSAHAEPLRITEGSASVDISGGDYFTFRLQGANFLAQGIVYKDEAGIGIDFTWPQVAQTGYPVDTSSQWNIYQAYATGSATLDYWAGSLQFSGGLAPLACVSKEGDYDCFARTPFTFTGSLTHYDEAGRPLLTRDLVGSGRAALAIDENLVPFALGYVFDDAAPVPEPATLLLFATGLGAIGRRAWRGRNRVARGVGS